MKFNEDLDLDGKSIINISKAEATGGEFIISEELDEFISGESNKLAGYYTKDEVDSLLTDFSSETATRLENSVEIQVNLESSSSVPETFDGSDDIVLGVSGVLSIGNGGTGNTSGLPASHASSSNTYGVGSDTNYGHLKLSDSIDSSLGVGSGCAITPGAVKTLSDTFMSGVYDQVIKTQSEFETLIASSTWLDAKSVAFVGGTSTFTLSDGSGVFVPDTVIRVDGFNNATIEVTNFVYNSSTNKGGFWRNIITDDTFTCSGMTVNCDSSRGFACCDNLTNCSGTGNYGFIYCDNLTNCSSTGVSYGFAYCDNLTNCSGTGVSYGFYNCDNLTNCSGTSTSTSSYPSSFRYCYNLTNCTGTGTSTYSGYGFEQCGNLTNCSGSGTGSSNSAFGFYDCDNLSNCTGYGTSSNLGCGFSSCYNLTNCTGTGSFVGFNWCGYTVSCVGSLNGCSNYLLHSTS